MVRPGRQYDEEGALADYALAIRLRPDLAEAYFRRARILARQDNRMQPFLISARRSTGSQQTDALAARANLLLTSRQDFVGAIADFDKLITSAGS